MLILIAELGHLVSVGTGGGREGKTRVTLAG